MKFYCGCGFRTIRKSTYDLHIKTCKDADKKYQPPPADYSKYQNAIKTQLSLNIEDLYFKSSDDYTYMCEHVNNMQGNEYLNFIRSKFSTFYENNLDLLIEKCQLNDKYGKTKKNNFDNFTSCSPSNLRYILHTLLILEDMKKYNLNNIDIIEIGGGYGGLCFFVNSLAPLYNINIKSYTIFDLLEPSLLQEKYLNALNINNVNFYQLDNFKTLNKNSFLISTYAFSEISMSIQNKYSEKIINPYTNFGFISWNDISLYNFVENSIIEKEKEYPLTGGKYNYYVRYYPKYFKI